MNSQEQLKQIEESWLAKLHIWSPFHDDIGWLINRIKTLENNCLHPGCCCVCGHRRTCPEDGQAM